MYHVGGQNMRKFLLTLILIIVLGSSVGINAEEKQDFEWSFHDLLGWNTNLMLQGQTPATVFYLPAPPGVDWQQSILMLQIKTSSFLDTNSSISVFVDDALLTSIPLEKRTKLTIPILLSPLTGKPSGENVKIMIQPYLSISRNVCEDLASGHLWCEIQADSSYSLVIKEKPIMTLNDYFQFPHKQIEILLPQGNWSRELTTSYMDLCAFLKRTYRGLPVVITTKIFTDQNEIPKEMGKKQIILLENDTRDYRLDNGSLFLTPQGVEAVIKQKEAFSFPSTKIRTSRSEIDEIPNENITLAQLGVAPLSLKGIGEMREHIYFPTADLKGMPRSLSLMLKWNSFPLQESTLNDALLKISLNDVLLRVERIPQSRTASLKLTRIPLPIEALRRENSLDISVLYFPEVNNCRQGTLPFEAFISDKSYLARQGKQSLPSVLTWNDVPTLFWGKGLIVLPDQPSLEELEIGAKIFATLREIDHNPIQIEIMPNTLAKENWFHSQSFSWRFHQSLRKIQEESFSILRTMNQILQSPELQQKPLLERILFIFYTALKSYFFIFRNYLSIALLPFTEITPRNNSEYIILVSQENDDFWFGSPVQLRQEEIKFYRLPSNEYTMTLSPDESLGILAVTKKNNTPFILFAPYGSKEIAYRHFLDTFHGAETLRRMSGNVTLFGPGGKADLRTDYGFTLVMVGNVFQEFYNRYRFFLLVGVLILLVIVFGAFYSKMTQPPIKK